MRTAMAVLFALFVAVIGKAPSHSAPDPRFSRTLPAPSFFVTLYGEVAILDPTTNKIVRIATFPTTVSPMVAAQTRPLVFLQPTPTTIDEVNTNTLKVVASVGGSTTITGMTVSPTDDALFVSSGNDVLEMSLPSLTITQTIVLPDQVYDVAFIGDGSMLIATLPNTHRFAIIDLPTHSVKGYIAAGPCIHDGRRDHCTPHDVRTSPGGQYAIGVSSRNAVVVDTQANKVVAAPAIGGLEFPNYALAVDPSTNELWLESKGSEFNWLNSMSQLPPFNILTSTYSTKSYFPYSAAFSPTGQGFGSFFGAEQDKITSFPPSPNELKIKVDRKTGPIVYVP